MKRRSFIKRVAIGATLAPLAATAGVEMCKKKSFQVTCTADWQPTNDWTTIRIPGVMLRENAAWRMIDFEIPMNEASKLMIGGGKLTLIDKDGKPNKKYVKS